MYSSNLEIYYYRGTKRVERFLHNSYKTMLGSRFQQSVQNLLTILITILSETKSRTANRSLTVHYTNCAFRTFWCGIPHLAFEDYLIN